MRRSGMPTFAAPFRAMLLVATVAVTASPASAETLTVWWNKGFFPAEDAAFEKVVAEWEAATGNEVNLSFYATGDIAAKFVSAFASGNPPDVAYGDVNDFLIAPQQAWNDRLADVSDVVKPIEGKYTKTALLSGYYYNNVQKKRSYYAVPIKQQSLHDFYWRPMVEAAGFKDADIPTGWNEYWKFWEGVQDKLRDDGKRVNSLGFPMSTVDTDNFYTFNQYLLAFGGRIVNQDGTLNLTEQTRKAAIDTVTFLTDLYERGYVPKAAINWGDPDNNAAFYSKQIVMTSNASISIPVAKSDDRKLYEQEIGTRQQPLAPDGKPMTSLVAVKNVMVPKGAKEVELAKEFLKYFTEPMRLSGYLAAARGRWSPVMPEVLESDPFWRNMKDPHVTAAISQEFDGPTEPWPMAYNPAYAQVNAEEVWGKAEGDVAVNGKTPEEAVDTAFARIKEIFAQYPVAAD